MFPPERIVCPTEETVETLYLLGEAARIVGISGYTVRPPEAGREKPRVSAFTSADIEKILALAPDLVLTFSDLQAEIAADLIRRGIAVHAFNQRDVAGILAMIRMLGALVGAGDRAAALADRLETGLAAARERGARLAHRPRIFFEEWDDPLISGIGWVSELIEVAGGIDVFAERARKGAARDRIVTAEEVDRPRPRSHHRLLVRQEVPAGASDRAAWLRRTSRGADGRPARDQVIPYPAAWAGGADRRARRDREADRRMGRDRALITPEAPASATR